MGPPSCAPGRADAVSHAVKQDPLVVAVDPADSSTPVASISSSLARSRFMPPTDGFDELALIRFRGECGWSSSTATSASRPSRIGADRRSAMRCARQGADLLPGTPYRAAQHRVGRREDVFVAKPAPCPRQQRARAIEP